MSGTGDTYSFKKYCICFKLYRGRKNFLLIKEESLSHEGSSHISRMLVKSGRVKGPERLERGGPC
jgi:hypothetical protein